MKAAELFVKCLENEGVEYVFGVPGEENVDIMDALLESPIKFITTRHEQGAAFMADVYGRLTCKAGVCLSTLGPGATNLITGVADADMDRAPVVAIAGEGATTRMHKESHQILDLVNMFEPITKYATQIREPEIVSEVVRKAFKVAQTEKPGACFIDFPENIAAAEIVGKRPIEVQKAYTSTPPELKIAQAAHIISQAKCPIILAGNGVIRASASDSLAAFAETLQIPVATTFMAKGAIPCSHELSLGTIGLKAKDWVSFGFESADVVICVGYDMVEYHPEQWNPEGTKGIVHIDVSPAEVDEHYILRVGVLGDLGEALRAISRQTKPQAGYSLRRLREAIVQEMAEFACDDSFPIKPQRIVSDLRHALAPDDIVISDVGAHKMWMGRMYQAERPNTCIISNGFASMGIAIPGAVAAKLAHPNRKVVAVTGDAGFMMNSQEIETALRVGTPMVVLIWNDSEYGLITWHQLRRFGRPSHIGFNNPDFVKYAESFGAKGYRIERAGDLVSTLKQALADNTVAIIDCPVDYSENMKLTEKLLTLKSPV
jgi:acetolactate synthase I/II/III large subunit